MTLDPSKSSPDGVTRAVEHVEAMVASGRVPSYPDPEDVDTVRRVHVGDGDVVEVGCEQVVGVGPGFRLIHVAADGGYGDVIDVCCDPDTIRAVAFALLHLANEQEGR